MKGRTKEKLDVTRPGAVSLRDLVARVADEPSARNQAAFSRALLTAKLFVKITGAADISGAGGGQIVGPESRMRIACSLLPNGMRMVRTSAVPPRNIAADETVATLGALEVMEMVLKMPADGMIVAAEDERNSWTALTREGIVQIVRAAKIGT